MDRGWLVLLVGLGYLGLLFGIAYYGDRRAGVGRGITANPYVYALSIGVYCTSWTYYGSVGRAASSGIGFLPIYLGPTLMFVLGWFPLRKILHLSKTWNLTSIADFIASRYGKSHLIAGLVTVMAVVGITPYIALQLKAVATSFEVLTGPLPVVVSGTAIWKPDTALFVAILMAAFAILFGTRHINASEHHEGMMAAIAFESVVKFLAFVAVGLFVALGLFDGLSDLFTRASADPRIAELFTPDAVIRNGNWVTLILLSMSAIICLPRQFQVVVVENVDIAHFTKAIWLFPLYLLAINVFVLPIAVGGLLRFPGGSVDADTFVLALPLAEGHPGLALVAFLGGLSAATGMVIVESIALSTMICNDLVMPLLLRWKGLGLQERGDLGGLLKAIRRVGIVLLLGLSYAYFKLLGEAYTLVSIGLLSFAAAAQFAPAIFLGLYWRGGTAPGALAGLLAGFATWGYTLLLPSFVRSGWLPETFLSQGPWGLAFLKPQSLFGVVGLDPLTHSLFWSLLANIGFLVLVSWVRRQTPIERAQATLFVESVSPIPEGPAAVRWQSRARVGRLRALAARFLGREGAEEAFRRHAEARKTKLSSFDVADVPLVQFTERLLGGIIGASSARVVVASVVQDDGISMNEMMTVLDEASQVLSYSRQLEQKSLALERATIELRQANRRLKELDSMKDEFLSSVTHELRTPLTSIRSFSEILQDNPSLELSRRSEFLGIIIKESERLARLINQVLDLARIESGRMVWREQVVRMGDVVREAAASMRGVLAERRILLDLSIPEDVAPVWGDHDALMQVVLNLLSNAARFAVHDTGRIEVRVWNEAETLCVSVADNGPGIPEEDQEIIFQKFRQARNATGGTGGTGLGLAICRRIIDHLQGNIWVESKPGHGATFVFRIPVMSSDARTG
ncbi:MAG: ATP-binding protein [Alphaproteobacteria bacterium]